MNYNFYNLEAFSEKLFLLPVNDVISNHLKSQISFRVYVVKNYFNLYENMTSQLNN